MEHTNINDAIRLQMLEGIHEIVWLKSKGLSNLFSVFYTLLSGKKNMDKYP